MAKKHPASIRKAGTVVIDPPPAAVSLLTGDDEERESVRQEAHARWEAESRGAFLTGSLGYAVEQWKDAGLDPGAVVRAITDDEDHILAEAVMALTRRPQIEIKKPRQGKSRWTHKEQGELMLAVWRGLARKRAAASPLEPHPKVTIRTVCNALVGRTGPEKWRKLSGQGLEARHREALKSPIGHALGPLLDRASHYRSQGKINADELAALIEHLERFVSSL